MDETIPRVLVLGLFEKFFEHLPVAIDPIVDHVAFHQQPCLVRPHTAKGTESKGLHHLGQPIDFDGFFAFGLRNGFGFLRP